MSEKHLKSHQYYFDLYDRGTVEQCRRAEQSNGKDDVEPPSGTRISKRQAKRIKKHIEDMFVRIKAGERYLNKSQTIREWMDADQKKDELYESAQAPEDIRCLTCRNRLKPTFKELWYTQGKEDRVLFMYDCPNKCMPRRAFFSDGEEWRLTPKLCLRCSTPLKHESEDDCIKLITTYACQKCGYLEKDEYVWTHKKDDEYDENFAKDRDRFCLTAEEGSKYQDQKWQLEQMAKLSDEWKEKDKVRDEKLKQNPKGFHLDGVGYRCAICHDNTRQGDNWYDEWGIKCLVCQKAIDNGEIPPELAKYEDTWYTKSDLEHYFNIKAPALRRWINDGVIKPRTISYYGNGIHTQIFLMRDNKNLLPPKKLLKGSSVKERINGKDWSHIEPWYRFVDPFKHLKGYRIMRYLRIVPPEEMKAREEAEKKKLEEKQVRRELKKAVRLKKK